MKGFNFSWLLLALTTHTFLWTRTKRQFCMLLKHTHSLPARGLECEWLRPGCSQQESAVCWHFLESRQLGALVKHRCLLGCLTCVFHVNHYTHDILLAILELNELRWRFVTYEFKKELIWIGVVIHTCNPSTRGTETKTKPCQESEAGLVYKLRPGHKTKKTDRTEIHLLWTLL